jgi:hypothetical protein
MSARDNRPEFQSPVLAPLTVRLPASREEEMAPPCLADEEHGSASEAIAPARALLPICEMCGVQYDPSERVDDMPFCSYECASGGGAAACVHECPADIGGCLDPEHCECACADCGYARLPLCDSHPQCDHCGVSVREPGLCDRCLREFREAERWANETCGDCCLKNRDCHCYEGDCPGPNGWG